MLLVRAVAAGRLDYYLREPDGSLALGVFGGKAAGTLGLLGEAVTEERVAALAGGFDPHSGEQLARRSRNVRNVAYDCVFAMPKSVSLLFGLADAAERQQVVAVHEAARTAALDYLEREACSVLGSHRVDRRPVPADGFVWAVFLHRTSRAGDPHLHSHVLVFNLAPSRTRGWSVINSDPLFAKRRVTSYLYENDLRHELVSRFGLSFRARSGPASDIAGFSDRMIDAFSLRRAQFLADPWAPSPPKVLDEDPEILTERWRERARSLGYLAHAPRLALERPSPDAAVRRAVAASSTSFDRAFLKSELLAQVFEAATVVAPSRQIESAVEELMASETVPLEPGRLVTYQPGLRGPLRELEAPRVRRATLELLDWEASLVGSASLLLDEAGRCPLEVPAVSSALVVSSTRLRPFETYGALRSVALAFQGEGRRIEALSTTPRALADFEAATGIGGSSHATRTAPLERGDVLVLVDPARLPLPRRVELIELSLRGGVNVVVLDAWLDERLRSLGAAAREAARPLAMPQEAEWLSSKGGSVALAASLEAALGLLGSRVRELGPSARAVLPSRLQGWVAAECIAPRELARAIGSGLGPFVALGGRRSLPRPPRVTLEHVVVEPLGLAENERAALARSLVRRVERSEERERFSSELWRAAGWIELSREAPRSRGLAHEEPSRVRALE